MSTLNVPGAKLYHEISGREPLRIMISGAAGTGQVFRLLLGLFAERYQVVTYDRRGFSRSELDGPQDYDHSLDTDAEDVRRLIEELTDKPATVFGNSSGAIVVLEVLIRYAQWVNTVVAHESPVGNLLPDALKWITFFDEVYDTYHQSGVTKAMHQFANGTLGSEDSKVLARNMNCIRMSRTWLTLRTGWNTSCASIRGWNSTSMRSPHVPSKLCLSEGATRKTK
jgi:pimeloyl-ACP methyl ester carboxylesterase